MRVYAHRGASIERPENTLSSFKRALEIGCEGIELDIHLTKDGIPVVIHDDSVDRTTNGVGKVGDLTLAEIKALDAGNGEQIPTLADVFELVGDKVHFNLEIKTAEAAAGMLKDLANFPNVRWATSCFDLRGLDFVRAAKPGADTWVATFGSVEGSEAAARMIEALDIYPPDTLKMYAETLRANAMPIEQILDRAVALGSTSISIYWEALNGESIAKIHARGMQAWAWTVNDVEIGRRLMELGVDAICTDDPAAMFAMTTGNA